MTSWDALDYFNDSSAEITVLTETWLKTSIMHNTDRFHIAQSPHMHNQGIAIFAKKSIAQFQHVFPSLWTTNTIAVKIF